MRIKKVLSAFSTDSGLDFELFEKLLDDSDLIKNEILGLDETELNLLIVLLIENRRNLALSKLLPLLESSNTEYNQSLIVLGLIKFGILESSDDLKRNTHLLQGVTKENAFCLKPFEENFPEKYRQIIEASVALKREELEAFREELKDQIEFLKTEQLLEKALQIEDTLKFHFPEIKETFTSQKHAKEKSEEHRFSKIIERNLFFEARSTKRKGAEPSKYEISLSSDTSKSLELAELWYADLKDTAPELLLTQLEFMNFDDADFYSKMLQDERNGSKLDTWTKAFLYLKSKTYLEGLEFLEENEEELLTDSADSIYNYYYTKGLLLAGAGMQKEAEEIFLIIQEQKENFRDIQLLLLNTK